MTQVVVPPQAAATLLTLYREREAAETRLVQYLAGVVDALGIDPATVRGFDDTAGAILVADPSTEPQQEGADATD